MPCVIPQQFFIKASSGPVFVGPLDAYTSNLVAAYSLSRRLLSSYIGPLYNIRRSSDNATLDIGYLTSGEANTSAATSFTSTNNAYETIIYDQTGNGQHMIQSTTASQPITISSGTLQQFNSLKPAMLTNTSGPTYLGCATLQASNVRAYSAAVYSPTALWSGYGAFLEANAVVSGNSLGFPNSGATNFYSGTNLPLAVRRNGSSLSSPYDMTPINSPMILGVDTGASTHATDGTSISIAWGLTALPNALIFSEMAVWSATADRTAFEAAQKTYFGL